MDDINEIFNNELEELVMNDIFGIVAQMQLFPFTIQLVFRGKCDKATILNLRTVSHGVTPLFERKKFGIQDIFLFSIKLPRGLL